MSDEVRQTFHRLLFIIISLAKMSATILHIPLKLFGLLMK